MKDSLVQILFVLICTVVAAALQDLLPAVFEVKFPILLALVLNWTLSEPRPDPRDERTGQTPFFFARWIPCALFAGAFEDALSELPTGCAAGFFLLACSLARLLRPSLENLTPFLQGLLALAFAAPLHEIWLGAWDVTGDALVVRFFASTLPALPVGLVVFTLLPLLEVRVGFNGIHETRRFG